MSSYSGSPQGQPVRHTSDPFHRKKCIAAKSLPVEIDQLTALRPSGILDEKTGTLQREVILVDVHQQHGFVGEIRKAGQLFPSLQIPPAWCSIATNAFWRKSWKGEV